MSNSGTPWKAFSMANLIALDIGICTAIGYWVGSRFDLWMDTAPIGVIVGVLIGLGAGVMSVIPVINKYLRDTE